MSAQTIQQDLDQALRHHQAGQIAEAQTLYRQVLAQEPQQADALHGLGIARAQLGHVDEAIELIQRAIQVNPSQPHYLANLAGLFSQQRRFAEAIEAYRRAIALNISVADWHQNLGSALLNGGKFEEAIESYRQAVRLRPDFPEALSNLGVALKALGRLDEAASCYRQSIALRPSAQGYNQLGSVLLQMGRAGEAAETYVQAAALRPDDAEAHYNIGVAHGAARDFDRAIEALNRAVALRPDYPNAWNNLGNAHAEKQQFSEAVAAYRRAIQCQPAMAEAHNNLGVALQQLGKLTEAIECYHESLRLRPNHAPAYYHLGNALKNMGETEQAERAIRSALSFRADYAEAYVTLSALLMDQDKWEQAIDTARKAIEARPNWPGGYNNLGLIFLTRGEHAEALSFFRRALEMDPQFREALLNVGTTLLDMGKLDEAMEALRLALRHYPDLVEAQMNLGNALKEAGQIDAAIQAYRDALAIKENAVAADNLLLGLYYVPGLNPDQILEEHLRWGEACAAKVTGKKDGSSSRHAPRAEADGTRKGADWATARDRVPATGKLRIGYVSPDFRRHVVGYNVLPLMENHNRDRFEIFLYSNVRRSDDVTDRFRSACHEFRDIKATTDAQAAGLIGRDAIDILVDLALHSSGNRLPIFARKPAPVQVTFAGYPGTTGLRQIDFRLTDPYVDPPDQTDEAYSERSWRLPDSFWCYKPYVDPPPVSALPASANGYVTFGCLNAFWKVNRVVLELWARVLRELPSSQMIILSRPGSHRQQTLALFQSHRVDPSRIEFIDYQPLDYYLRTYHRIDIGLDTFPYNGHTTAIETLWMGVPIVTLVGRTAVSRAGWCQLSNIGLAELGAQEPDEFVRIATSLASDLPRLAKMRSGLRRRMEDSPLMDFARFTRNIETAYQQMWERLISQTSNQK